MVITSGNISLHRIFFCAVDHTLSAGLLNLLAICDLFLLPIVAYIGSFDWPDDGRISDSWLPPPISGFATSVMPDNLGRLGDDSIIRLTSCPLLCPNVLNFSISVFVGLCRVAGWSLIGLHGLLLLSLPSRFFFFFERSTFA